jgi:hypothetical protein
MKVAKPLDEFWADAEFAGCHADVAAVRFETSPDRVPLTSLCAERCAPRVSMFGCVCDLLNTFLSM